MSIDQTNIVDAIGIDDATGKVILTISDHLEWTGRDNDHLLLLQEKINTYLRFIESGEIFESYPNAKGASLLIDVVGKYPLNQAAKLFYDQVTSIVEGAGMKLRHRFFDAH